MSSMACRSMNPARPPAGGPDESDALVELFLTSHTPPDGAGPHEPAPGASGTVVAQTPTIAVTRPATAKPSQSAESAAAARPGSLVACLRGLRAIEGRCPYARTVELGVDAEGVLHAVAWLGHADSGSVVADVLTACQWAREHAELLSRLTPGPVRAEALAHLVTDRAERVRWLGASGIRLHLAVRAGATWMAAPL